MRLIFDLLYDFYKNIAIKEIKSTFEDETRIFYEYDQSEFNKNDLNECDLKTLLEKIEKFVLITAVSLDDSCNLVSPSGVKAFKEFIEDENIIKLKIEFKKDKFIEEFTESSHNCVFFTSIHETLNWLNKKDINQLETCFSETNKTVILLLEDDISINNGYIYIINCDKYSISMSSNRFDETFNDKIKFRNDHCNWQNSTRWMTPEYLYFKFPNDYDTHYSELKNYFHKQTTNLIISYLASATYVEQGETLTVISGLKKISFAIKGKENYNQENIDYLYKTYKWVYSDEYNSDKIYMVRNLLTVYLCDQCSKDYYSLILEKSKQIYDTTISNFDVYLKENVENYFKERNNLRKLIHDTRIEISREIDAIISNITKNFLSSIGVILITLITYVNQGNKNMFKGALSLYIIFMVANLLFFIFHYKYKVAMIVEYFNNQLTIFDKILFGTHVPTEDESLGSVKKRFYWFYGIIIVLNVILIFAAGYVVLRFDETVRTFMEIIK